METRIIILSAILFLLGCKNGKDLHDASGVFEAEEVIVSSEIGGKILKFQPDEGAKLVAGDSTVIIDATNIRLQKEQVEASIGALSDKTTDVGPQVELLKNQLSVQETQMATLEKERQRFEKLVKADAATGKQLDDIVAQIDQLKKQMDVTRQQIKVQQNITGTQNRGILSEKDPLDKRVAQLDDQLQRSVVLNPVSGIILTKYAEAGEVTSPGKALYKIADLDLLRLRAYLTGDQVATVKLGQAVKVAVDDGKGGFRNYEGKISWISDKAEFTPKTIQTKEERANLVYAVKIDVKNDGYLKIGMYGEVDLQVAGPR
ncbi:MAG TPA: HlyD family efflux transporter periplasmic adaptor subunit [Chitinophagaceae bacterium]|nr:HlyD family efflux transporter periplasmic adaptor subunit [Chitinophagaceae bacterium]